MRSEDRPVENTGMDIDPGTRFTRLVVIGRSEATNRVAWVCRCDCGNITTLRTSALRGGTTKSCGCLRAALWAAGNVTHGGSRTRTYKTWISMRERVRNGADQDTSRGRYWAGVSIDPSWDDYAVFLKDMGPRPEGTSIDRIDSTADYNKANCRWATPHEQAMNRRPHTHCKRMHPLSGDNLQIRANGGRVCIACQRLRSHAAYLRKKLADTELGTYLMANRDGVTHVSPTL